MARKAPLVLACLALAAVVATGLTGCTWTETHREYPASLYQQADGHGHDHGHGHAH